jgi:hypothetical protein
VSNTHTLAQPGHAEHAHSSEEGSDAHVTRHEHERGHADGSQQPHADVESHVHQMGMQLGKPSSSNNNGGKQKSVRFGETGQTDITSIDTSDDSMGATSRDDSMGAQNDASVAYGGKTLTENETTSPARENTRLQLITEAQRNKTGTDTTTKESSAHGAASASASEVEGARRVLPVRRADPSSLLSELTRHVCMYIYVYVYVYEYVYAKEYVYVFVSVHVYVHTHTHTFPGMCAGMCVRCILSYICTCIYIYIYIYAGTKKTVFWATQFPPNFEAQARPLATA